MAWIDAAGLVDPRTSDGPGELRCFVRTPELADFCVAAAWRPRRFGGGEPAGWLWHSYLLETDTSDRAVCQPRWLPDAARLFNGNGSTPFSSGLASRDEFFDAVARGDVVKALQGELKQLCALREPKAQWIWTTPPRSEAEVIPVELPALEEEDLLTNPVEELKRLKELMKHQPDVP